MKITREKACQRLHHRVNTPLAVTIDGSTYKAVDWSIGGLRLSGWNQFDTVSVTDGMECHFSLPFQGFDIAFTTSIEVVRLIEADQEIAFRFIGLDDRQVELMNHFVEQLIRGAMTPIDDTILRIDSPVTPVSTKPDPSPTEEVPVSRWPIKLIGMSVFYLVLGVGVFSLLAKTIFDNFLSIEVAHAYTEKPVEELVSLTDGRISFVNARQHRDISAGEPLFRISSPDLNQQIKDAKIDLEQTKLELESLRKKHAVVIDIHKSHLVKEARFIEIEIDKKQQEVTLATETLVALYEHKEELLVASPGEGRLVRILRNEGSLVRKGEPLALFERDGEPMVVAYVSEPEARHLAIYERAVVRSEFYDTAWEAEISAIVPARRDELGFLPGERTMRVELRLFAGAAHLASGSPVRVEFPATRIDNLLPGGAEAVQEQVAGLL